MNVTVLPVFGLSGESCISAKEMWGTVKQVNIKYYHNFIFDPTEHEIYKFPKKGEISEVSLV